MSDRFHSASDYAFFKKTIRGVVGGSKPLRDLFDLLSNSSFTREEVMPELLRASGIQITGNEKFSSERFKTQKALGGIKVFESMLGVEGYSSPLISHFWKNITPSNTLWLEAFSSGLRAKDLCTLLLTRPSAVAARSTSKPFSEIFLGVVPKHEQEQITVVAKKRRQLKDLYVLTGWECCRALAEPNELDQFLGADLGL